jgi:DNA polymerase sigma
MQPTIMTSCDIPSKNLLSDLYIDSNGWLSCQHTNNSPNEIAATERTNSSASSATIGTKATAVPRRRYVSDSTTATTLMTTTDDIALDDNDRDDNSDNIAIFPACQTLLSLLQLKVVTATHHHGPKKKQENHHRNYLKFHSYVSLRSGKTYKISTTTSLYPYYGSDKGDALLNLECDNGDQQVDNGNDDDIDNDNLQDWNHISSNISDLISSILVQIMKMHNSSSWRRRSRGDDKHTGGSTGKKSRNRKHDKNSDEMDLDDIDNAEDTSHGDINTTNNTSSDRMMQTFNTISIFLPIVMSMIQHARKHSVDDNGVCGDGIDGGVDHGRNKMGKRTRKKKVCLLFQMAQAYSIVTLGQFNTIKNDVKRLEKIMHGWMCKVNRCQNWHHSRNPKYPTHHDASSTLVVPVPSIPWLLVYHSTQSRLSSCPQDLFHKTILQFCNFSKQLAYGRQIDDAIIQPLIMDENNLHRLYRNSVQILCNRLSQILSRRFKGSHLSVYGSCLSGLSLGHSSDVDLSLYIPAVEELQENKMHMNERTFQKQMKNFVYKVYHCIQDQNHNHARGHSNYKDNHHHHRHHGPMEFEDMEAVPFARVPVVKGRYQYAGNPFTKDGSIHFDICIMNDIAVANSGLLREYSLLDPRVRLLMLSVKSWIKWKDIGNAAERTLSSYTWMVMVIFYLQCIDFVPNLQCREFMEKHGVLDSNNDDLLSSRNRMNNINGLKTIYLHHDIVLAKGVWKQPRHFESISVSALLLGFFTFYARYFSQETASVSIRLGNMSLQKTVFSKSSNLWRIVIEDPFETYDSHIPHDLGTPMDEKGQEKVTKALQEAANTMEKMFTSCHEIVDCIGRNASSTTKYVIMDQKKQQVPQKMKSRSNNMSLRPEANSNIRRRFVHKKKHDERKV